ncbi:MAG: hypothetical protein ABIO86_03370 [Sphingomonas sp.]
MGNLRFLAVIAGLDDTSSLHAISETILWRAYKMRRTGLVLIEWLKRPNPNNVPRSHVIFPNEPSFACRPSGVSFESSFGSSAGGLDGLYAELELQHRAGTVPAVAVHTTLLLHRLTSRPVLGIASDDDDWDFVCEARDGIVHKVRFLSDEDEFRMARDGQVHRLDAGTAPRELHQIARQESAAWSDELSALFGDGGGDMLDLVEVDRCQIDQGLIDRSMPSKRPFWRLW